MTDFIKDLKKDILESMPEVSKEWAEFCAIISLSTILPRARIIERVAPLNLNLFMLMVGPPGITKSLPLMGYTKRIVYDTGKRIGLDLILPSRYSVEGMINYLNSGKDNDLPRHVGIIIRDEFSGVFKQLRKAEWQTDGMEFLSEMYDNTFQKRVTTSHGLHTVDKLYANLITATTPYFLSCLDANFFIQGTGNRFLYTYYGIDDYEIEEVDFMEFFAKDWGEKREDVIEKHANRLVDVYKQDIHDIYMSEDAGQIWIEYKKQCETEWKAKSKEDPRGWSYHPIKRYPEFALKLSGNYCISSFIDNISDMVPSGPKSSFLVSPKQMQRAIDFVEGNRGSFERIVIEKARNIPGRKVESIEDEAKTFLAILLSAKDGMMTSSNWIERCETSASNEKINKLRRYCLAKGWVKSLTCSEVDLETRKRLGMRSSSVVYKYIRGI